MFAMLKSLWHAGPKKRKAPPRVQLHVERLEDRAVPTATYLAANFPAYGLYLYSPFTQHWQHLAPLHPSKLAVDTGGDVVADFTGRGLYVWNNNPYSAGHGWHHLTSVDARAVAIAGLGGFTVAASFPGYGVYESVNAGPLQRLTSSVASLVGVDAAGDVVGEFPNLGVWLHPAYQNWYRLTSTDASAISMSEVYIVGEFPGNGVWLYDMNQYSWTQIISIDATAVSVCDAGLVVASFQNYGVYTYYEGQWQNTNAPGSASQVGGNTTEVDGLLGNRIWQYDAATSQWRQLISVYCDLMACAD
jgi:hypothetical protein